MANDRITLDRVDEMMRAVFTELKRVGGRARPKDIFASIAPKLKLTEYELAHNKSQTIRWQTMIRFYTIDCVKAGFLQRASGHWILTEEGEKALNLRPGELMRVAGEKYRQWKKSQQDEAEMNNGGGEDESDTATRQTLYEQAVESAQDEIERHIHDMDPYEFQKLVAELLKAMDYYVPFIAAPGPDGGIDLQAYKDPLGTSAPRIKVQVKHRRDNKLNAKEVRELEGLLRKDGDIGLLVSSSGFTSDADREIRSSVKHIETMDLERLIELWKIHYEKISERGKTLLPLVKVFFLAPTEE